MSLGCKQDAKLIYRRRKTGYGPLPKGWKKLGAGAYRTSYLSPDQVVYKVCHQDEYDSGDHWSNLCEFNVFKRCRISKARLPRGWRIAKTKLYSFDCDDGQVHIIAMEYVEGKHLEIGPDDDDEIIFSKIGATKAYEVIGLYDLHEGNFVVTPDGKNVIIDLGE
jgi:hypothetical protein